MLYELGQHQIELPFRHNTPDNNGRLLLWHEGRLLCEEGNPVWSATDHPFDVDKLEFIGLLDNKPYFTGQVIQAAGTETITLRDLALVSETLFMLASRAKGLLEWRAQHQFCGQCGQKTKQIVTEFALTCEPCRLRFYPRISPCIIVLITNGDQVLLAQGERHRDRGWYSTLAGFVETGESAEQAVIREVQEEVGVKLKNIRYLNSQTWPFPNQLMLGFHAEYAGGEITPQVGEIADAAWFKLDDLPKYPPNLTIAGWLIQSYLKERQS
ncbi:NAD(+) diphosphatase [Reinekea sp.]|jgi:NAD+ diphosphatase|uniref:NAD(+) diphosphatase n=1 Tax=Reinekea sp. TaxID=1970455 RepID=UPI00398A4730